MIRNLLLCVHCTGMPRSSKVHSPEATPEANIQQARGSMALEIQASEVPMSKLLPWATQTDVM